MLPPTSDRKERLAPFGFGNGRILEALPGEGRLTRYFHAIAGQLLVLQKSDGVVIPVSRVDSRIRFCSRSSPISVRRPLRREAKVLYNIRMDCAHAAAASME